MMVSSQLLSLWAVPKAVSFFLWLVLVDEVLELPVDLNSQTLAYVDDITLVSSHKDPAVATRELQSIVSTVNIWANSMELSINPAKTSFMLFSRKRKWQQLVALLLFSSRQPSKSTSWVFSSTTG